MINIFLAFEEENDLFRLKIRGVNIWHLIRVNIYNEMVQQYYSIPKAHQSLTTNNKITRSISKIKQTSNIFVNNPYRNLSKKDVLIFNHHRRVRNNEYYHCLYTSELINSLKENYYVYENSYQQQHYKPVPEKNIKYTDIIGNKWLGRRILQKLLNKKIITDEEENLVKSLINMINNKFHVKLNQKQWIKRIENIVFTFNGLYKSYSKIIEEINPKIIIQVVSYEISRYAVNKVAKEKKIPTVELQHGTMGKYHIAYNFAEKMEIDTFPDYVLTFGDYWKENTRLPIDDSKVISVGWPYYEDKVKKQNKVNSNKSTLLFISQGTIGKQLSKIAKEVEESIDFDKYRIIYKLHPGEYDVWRENYPWLINSSIEVIDHNDFDMHYYFNQADIQIGVNSTAIFEGLGYNLKTFIFKFYGYEYMEDLYGNGYVKLVEKAKDLVHYLNKDVVVSDNVDASYFWESNSMEKMLTEIKKIAGTDFKTKRND